MALGQHSIEVTKYIYCVLFSQCLYNSHLKQKVQGATNTKCLNDAFKIAQYYLNKEKSFQCLNNNDPVLRKNEDKDKSTSGYITINNIGSNDLIQPDVSHPICDHCINEINTHRSTDQRYLPGGYQGYCYRCSQWGHMARNCGDSTSVVSDTTTS